MSDYLYDNITSGSETNGASTSVSKTTGSAEPRSSEVVTTVSRVLEFSAPRLIDEHVVGRHRDGWSVTDGTLTVDLTVSVVIPTRNEAANLPSVLPQIPLAHTEVIIVDGGSTDRSLQVAHELRPDAKLLRQQSRGKGDALRLGFEAATGDIIVMMDGDGSMTPREIPAFVAALVAGADLAKGSRRVRGGGSEDLTHIRMVGNSALTAIFNKMYGASHSDLCYGYLAFWARHRDVLTPTTAGFEVETWMNVRAAQEGLRVAEVPSVEGRRIHGGSNLRTFRDGFRVARTLLGPDTDQPECN